MSNLDLSMFKPEPGPTTVAEIVTATVAFTAQARAAYKLDPDRVLIFSVPYDPPMRESWKQAELELRRDGHRIRFGWEKWDVWTVERGDIAGTIPAEWLVRPADGTASLPTWAATQPLAAERLRELAAECLAMADYLQTPHQIDMPGGL